MANRFFTRWLISFARIERVRGSSEGEVIGQHFSTRRAEMLMRNKFKIGDHVNWNSEVGRVSGTIVRVHRRDFDVNGYTHHASAKAPQYEIKSSKTEHIAFHKGSALTRLRD